MPKAWGEWKARKRKGKETEEETVRKRKLATKTYCWTDVHNWMYYVKGKC